MRTSDVDILIVPDLRDADSGHWQRRWRARLPTAATVEPGGAHGEGWVARLAERTGACSLPVVFVGHRAGTATVVRAAPLLPPGKALGAFLVGLPDPPSAAEGDGLTLPHTRLPFPSVLVASRTDPAYTYDQAASLAAAWGARLLDAGDAGRLDATSGHGPWPEGLMAFAGFLKRL